MRSLIVCMFFLSSAFIGISQNFNDSTVTIHGTLQSGASNNDFLRIMVVNKNTHRGNFGDAKGTFEITCKKRDTIAVSVIGYQTMEFSCVDSLFKKNYSVLLTLKPVSYNLKEVKVFPKRELEKIYEDINSKLGYNEKDYVLSGVNAIESPITFLYERYSKRAQAKRKAIELQNEELRRDLLKELLTQYVDADIIDLDTREFDQFIDYCRISDYLLQNTSQYEFAVLIKEKFKRFKRYGY